MWWFIFLLAVVLVIVFYPGISIMIQMTVLIGILLFIIGALVYVNYEKMKEKEASDATSNTCNTCSGPPSRCSDCNYNPCQCTQIIPGQTRCPRCPGSVQPTSMNGISGCSSCGRNYRCPGCLLQ
jgi:uncharacterized paraquat-inducible protein A